MLAAGFGRTVLQATRYILRQQRPFPFSWHARVHVRPISAMITEAKEPFWIDCDAGSDDALGILLAAKANIIGISTVRGNTVAERVSQNILRVLTLCSRQEVPVYTGANKSLNGDQQPVPKWSGQDGLNDQPDVFPASASISLKPASGMVSRKISEAAANHAGGLVVIATGPLTNLALAVQQDAQLVANVKRLVVMGGNEAHNDWTSTGAEFNFYCDPDAAEEVITKFSGKTTLLTWESMQRNPLPWETAEAVANKDSKRARFITAICGLGNSPAKQEGWVPCDPVAFAAALDASIVTAANDVQCKVETDHSSRRGQTSFDRLSAEGSGPPVQQSTYTGTICLVSKVNVDMVAAMLTASTDDHDEPTDELKLQQRR